MNSTSIDFASLPPAEQRRLLKQLGRGDDPKRMRPPALSGEPGAPRAASPLEALFDQVWARYGNGIAPLHEYCFALGIGRRWRFDRAWLPPKVAVELSGLKDHASAKGFRRDAAKFNAAQRLGWVVLTYTTADLKRRPAEVAAEVVELLWRTAGGQAHA